MIVFIIVCSVVVVFLAVIVISEFWYIKQKKDSDRAYLEDLRIQSTYIDEDENFSCCNHYPYEMNKGK